MQQKLSQYTIDRIRQRMRDMVRKEKEQKEKDTAAVKELNSFLTASYNRTR